MTKFPSITKLQSYFVEASSSIPFYFLCMLQYTIATILFGSEGIFPLKVIFFSVYS